MTAIVADFQNLVQGQNGILFWIAIAAITCGLSFLLTGVYLHLRRFWQLRRFRGLDPKTPHLQEAAAPESVERPDPDSTRQNMSRKGGLSSTRPVARELPQPAAHDLDARSLPTILKRLRQAADRLENMADELIGPGSPAAESPLKHLASEVEYVFRASRH